MALAMPPGLISNTEYTVHDADAGAIVRAATLDHWGLDSSVIWFPLSEHFAVRASIATSFERLSTTGLGDLDRLPYELMHAILIRTDVRSLFVFRQVNLRSRQMVDSLREYRVVAMHGLNFLCAILRTSTATQITLCDSFRVLCTKECFFCGEFGGVVSLIHWTRCCFWCLQEIPGMCVLTRSFARKHFRLSSAQTRQLKSFRSLPGSYTIEDVELKSRVALVDARQAESVCTRPPASPVDQLTCYRQRKLKYMGSCALPYYDKRTRELECGVRCAGCQCALDEGVLGTHAEPLALRAIQNLYSRDDFMKHFQWCKKAQLLWERKQIGHGCLSIDQ